MNSHDETSLGGKTIAPLSLSGPRPGTAPPLPPQFAEAGVRAELEAQRQADALGKGLGDLMRQSGLDAKRYVPLFGSYDGAKREISFLDMNSPGHQVKTVKVGSDELGSALDYVEGLPAQMKGAYTVDGEGKFHPVEVEIEGSFSGAEGLFAGLALQEIIKKLTETDEDLSAELKAHSYVGFTRTGVAGLQDIVKVGEMVGALTEGERLLSVAGNLSKALEVGGLLLDGANTGFDIYEIVNAKTLEEKVEYGTRLGNDLTTVAMGGAAFAADLAGAATAAGVISALAVPLAGLGIGIGALAKQWMGKAEHTDKINDYFNRAKEGYESAGYNWSDDKHSILVPQTGVVIDTLDLKNGKVTFGTNRMHEMSKGGGLNGLVDEFDATHGTGGVFDLWEGFGIKSQTVDLDKSSDVVVLPYMPICLGYFTSGTAFGSKSTAIEGINGKKKANGETIKFVTHHGGTKYENLKRAYANSTVKVVMGKVSQQLVMPDMAHMTGEVPTAEAYHSLDWSMNYNITGGGGSYGLTLSTYGGVTLSEDGDSNSHSHSSWTLMPSDKLSEEISVSDHSLNVGGETVSIKYPDSTIVRVMQKDGVIRTADFKEQKMVGAALSAEWFTKNPGATFSQMVAAANKYGVKDFDVSGMPIKGREVSGDNVSGSQPSLVSNTLSGRYDSAAGEVSGTDSLGVMLKVKVTGDLVPTLLGFGSEYFKRNPKATLKTLAGEASNYGEKDFIVLDMPIDGSHTMSGHYDAQQQKMIGVDEHGIIREVKYASVSRFNSSTMLGFAAPYFREHPHRTLSALVAAARQGGLGDFQVWDLPAKGEHTVSACYDAKLGELSGIDEQGAAVKIAEDLTLTLVGFGVDYFKKNPKATLADMAAMAKGYDVSDFDVGGMPRKDGRPMSGHYNATTRELVGPDEDGIVWKITSERAPAMLGFSSAYFKPPARPTLAGMVALAKAHGLGDFDAIEIPIGGASTASAHYDATTRKLIGTDTHGAIVAMSNTLAPTLLGFGAAYFKLNPQPTLDGMVTSAKAFGGADEFDVVDIPLKDGGTASGHYSGKTGQLSCTDSYGAIVTMSPTLTPSLAGFGAAYFKLNPHATLDSVVAAAASRYGADEFDVAGLPIEGKPVSGHYSAKTGKLVGTDAQGLIWEAQRGRSPVMLGFDSDYFQSAGTSLKAMLAIANAYDANGFDVLGMPLKGGRTMSGHYDATTAKLSCVDGQGAVWEVGMDGGPIMLGFGADYFKQHPQATLAQMAHTAAVDGAAEFVIDGLALPDGQLLSGRYNQQTRMFTGGTKDGAIYVVTPPQEATLLGADMSKLPQGAGMWPALKKLAAGKASVLVLVGVQDAQGTPVSAWYDVAAQKLVVGKSAAGGMLNYLGISDGKAWLFDAARGQLLSTAPLDQADSLTALAQARTADAQYENLPKLTSAFRRGAAIVVETDDGMTLRLNPADRADIELLEVRRGEADHGAGLKGLLDKYGYAQGGDVVHVRNGQGEHASYSWYSRTNGTFTSERAAAVQYVGYDTAGKRSYLFDPDKEMLFADDGSADPAGLVVRHVAREGNVVGLDGGISEAQLGRLRLPALDGVDTYVVNLDEGLSVRIKDGKTQLLAVDANWMAAHVQPGMAVDLSPLRARVERDTRVSAAMEQIDFAKFGAWVSACKDAEAVDAVVHAVGDQLGIGRAGRGYQGNVVAALDALRSRGADHYFVVDAAQKDVRAQLAASQKALDDGVAKNKTHVVLPNLADCAERYATSAFDVAGIVLMDGHILSGRYDGQQGAVTGADERGIRWRLGAGQDPAMLGYGAVYFQHNPRATLDGMVRTAKSLGTIEFDVVGMPIKGGHQVSGRYNAQTGKLLGTDEQGKVWDVKSAQDQTELPLAAAAWPQANRGQLAQTMSVFVQDGAVGKAVDVRSAPADILLASPLQSVRPGSGLA
ncbi:TcdA/TcdB pore-forming domain-containing protein [Duganella violaceipulchra]|uniref:TcdA/TcdB toxin pore forming domain-containing protein n=1 Tax=Duganella violaceipulchra TaxID=2849652 RepID=A0AA41HE48_9BURK|nr:TcdA/TcdB pore-forming domain-containing protein [Duganella violaceicalia]MBV6322476.1 hypothetical protein [Duganella violaceicalia]MCP2010681.1 hypothetical protein [Duganella violaceicalia]